MCFSNGINFQFLKIVEVVFVDEREGKKIYKDDNTSGYVSENQRMVIIEQEIIYE